MEIDWNVFGMTLLWAVFGLVLFGVSAFVAEKVTPFSIQKEISEKQNTALAVVLGAMFIGISLIIAAAIK